MAHDKAIGLKGWLAGPKQRGKEDESSQGEFATLSSHRLAILPFVNVSPDPNDEFFADGLTEELIDKLSQVRGLEVIARTSVMSFKKKEKKAAEIGRELKAGSLVEGSVRKAGNKVRVTAQLVNTNTEGHLWSSSYDRNLEDIFTVQSDVAERVADALKIQLLPNEKKALEKKSSESTEAYTLYLRGRFLWGQRSKRSLNEAIKCFEKAVALEPSFAKALIGIADCYLVLPEYADADAKESVSKAESAIKRALALDDTSAEGHVSLGFLLHSKFQYESSEQEFKKSIAINPNYATAHHWYSMLLLDMARKEDSFSEIEIAERCDPLSPSIKTFKGILYFNDGQTDEALVEFQEALAVEPGYSLAHGWRSDCFARKGMKAEALQALRAELEIQHNQRQYAMNVAILEARFGHRDELVRMVSGDLSWISPYQLVYAYVALGEMDKVYALIDREFDHIFAPGMLSAFALMYEANLADMKKDPRFKGLMARINVKWPMPDLTAKNSRTA